MCVSSNPNKISKWKDIYRIWRRFFRLRCLMFSPYILYIIFILCNYCKFNVNKEVGPKKNVCVSGFPTLSSFWHPKRLTLNFFWIDLPDLEGNQAILLKKRFEKLLSRSHLSKICPKPLSQVLCGQWKCWQHSVTLQEPPSFYSSIKPCQNLH